jgi:hypothetical protein
MGGIWLHTRKSVDLVLVASALCTARTFRVHV